MLSRAGILGLAVAAGVVFWVLDAALAYLFFSQGSFAELLITAVPRHQICVRVGVVLLLVTFGFVIAQMISARRAAEGALRDSEQRQRELVDRMSNGVAVYRAIDDGADFEFVDFNQAAQRIEQTPKADVIGRRVTEVFPGVREFGLLDVLRCVWRTGEPQHHPVRRYHDQRIAGWRDNFVYRLASGEVVCIYDDVTEQQRATEALRDREAALEAVFRAAPSGIGVVAGRVFTQANDRLCEMTGYTRQELLGQSDRMLYSTDEDYEFVGREKYAQIRARGTGTVETRWRRKDGTIIDVLLSSTPLNPADLSAGVTFTALDITARRQAEEERQKLEAQLRHAQKMEAVGQLAGGVAHDFNNILTAIIGNVELALGELEGKLPPDAPALDGMHQIEQSARRAVDLTRQLLAFSRRQVAQPRILDLNRTVTGIEKMLRRLLTQNVQLQICRARELWSVRADPGHVEQVIMNLVVNARDAMPNGGTLSIETTNVVLDAAHCTARPGLKPGRHVRLAVSDTGHGMDPATLERIFEPFFTTKSDAGGTGLGLATVYGIIQQAGGHIAVYSEPGQGTTFRIDLPAADLPADEPESVTDTPRAKLTGTETVLLCEDDSAVRTLAAHVLREAGYTVIATGRGAEALEQAQACSGALDLLITDAIMPDMNGRRLSERVTSLRPEVRTLFISGYTPNVILHHGVLDADVEFLEKPFSRGDLLSRVRKVLDQPRQMLT